MKSERQEKIIELIGKYEIDTQDELAEHLRAAGFRVTQATVSRDIRELRLTKIGIGNGKQKYISMNDAGESPSENQSKSDAGDMAGKMKLVLREGYISSREASHLVVVRTIPGMAMAVAAALDAMDIAGFAGCIAGDDTIFCALCSDADAQSFLEQIKAVMGQ